MIRGVIQQASCMLTGCISPPRHSAYRNNRRRGFNLIEAAIVLAVVGAVIGTIWGVSAKFYEDYKVNKTVEDLQLIVKNIQGLISRRDSEAMGNGVMIHQFLASTGVFPKDWRNASGSGLKHPFGGVVYVGNYIPPAGATEHRFYIMLQGGIPRSSCVKLVVKVSSIGVMAGTMTSGTLSYARPNLGVIGLEDSETLQRWETNVFPITPDTAGTVCHARNNISFGYGYTRTN